MMNYLLYSDIRVSTRFDLAIDRSFAGSLDLFHHDKLLRPGRQPLEWLRLSSSVAILTRCGLNVPVPGEARQEPDAWRQ